MSTATESQQLQLEAAVAARLLRAGHVPSAFMSWLDRPAPIATQWDIQLDPQVERLMQELFVPLQERSTKRHSRQIATAANCYAAMMQWIVQQWHDKDLEFVPRSISCLLLPLYRALATGDPTEAFDQSRIQLSQLFALIGLCQELEQDSAFLSQHASLMQQSPQDLLASELQLDLVATAAYLRQCSAGFCPQSRQFDADTVVKLSEFDEDLSRWPAPDWAESSLLWQLAGELMSHDANLVLPRSWADLPVQWPRINDHWQSMNHALFSPPAVATLTTATLTEVAAEEGGVTTALSANPSADSRGPLIAPMKTNGTGESIHTTEDDHTETNLASSDNCGAGSAPTQVRQAGQGQVAAGQEPLEEELPDAAEATTTERILIGLVRSPNDPVFTNAVQRRIAACRQGKRSLTLALLSVHPENPADIANLCRVHENGLAKWQQQVANWLTEHPEVSQTQAFVTSDGELIISLMDMERDAATPLLRQSLVQTLTGKNRLQVADQTSLMQLDIPAKFHVGIASTQITRPGFEADELIAATVRCYSAAKRTGSDAIKSIEVY